MDTPIKILPVTAGLQILNKDIRYATKDQMSKNKMNVASRSTLKIQPKKVGKNPYDILEGLLTKVRSDNCTHMNISQVNRDRIKPLGLVGDKPQYGNAIGHPKGLASSEFFPLNKPYLPARSFYLPQLYTAGLVK